MLALIIFLVLSTASLMWTLYSKLRRQKMLPRGERQYADLLTLGLPALAVLANAVLVYRFASVGLSTGEHLIQMLACGSVVPLIYMHFAWRVGRPTLNTTMIVLWLLYLLMLIPQVVIYNPFAAYEPLHFTPQPFAFYVVSHGEKLWAIYTGDLIVILQALVTVLRIVPLALRMHDNNLRFSRPIYAFFAWWISTAIYIVIVSSFDMHQLTTAFGTWFYYLGMTASLVSINVLFALHFDLHPVETEQGEVVENVDAYLDTLYTDLSLRMEAIVREEQIFRQAGYTVEDMCERLQTNRKVLSEMMLHHYGTHFPEYLNKRRLEYAQHLLLTTTMKVMQIATESGFAGTSHMNRLFKQQFDCTPTQWQKEHKGE